MEKRHGGGNMLVFTEKQTERQKVNVIKGPWKMSFTPPPSDLYLHPGPAYHNVSLPNSLHKICISGYINPLMGHTQLLSSNHF